MVHYRSPFAATFEPIGRVARMQVGLLGSASNNLFIFSDNAVSQVNSRVTNNDAYASGAHHDAGIYYAVKCLNQNNSGGSSIAHR